MLQQSKPVKFKDIPDGSYFQWAGSNTSPVMQKTMEDGGNHNAVFADNSQSGILYEANALVVLVQG